MKTVWLIVALVVIVGAVGYLISYYAGQPESGATVAYRAPVICEACGKAYITMLTDQPAKCFYCGEQRVWRAIQCADCSAIFSASPNTSGGTGAKVCPKCNSPRLKEVSADGLEEH
jgi:DNA-directed RNA polymerase subunit RPC12/RpoP